MPERSAKVDERADMAHRYVGFDQCRDFPPVEVGRTIGEAAAGPWQCTIKSTALVEPVQFKTQILIEMDFSRYTEFISGDSRRKCRSGYSLVEFRGITGTEHVRNWNADFETQIDWPLFTALGVKRHRSKHYCGKCYQKFLHTYSLPPNISRLLLPPDKEKQDTTHTEPSHFVSTYDDDGGFAEVS